MKILYISENKSTWKEITQIFEKYYPEFEMICVDGPEQAMEQGCNNAPFAIYIIDVDMQELDPNAIILNLIDFTGKRPVFFTGLEENFESKIKESFLKFNVYNGKILKPLQRDDLKEQLENHMQQAMNWVQQEEFAENLVEINPEEYIKMKLKSFYLYDEFPYDLFLGITQNCYVKLIKANKKYTHSFLASYAKRNVKFLFIQKDEMLKFLEIEKAKCLKALQIIKWHKTEIYLVLLRSITLVHQYVHAVGATSETHELVGDIIDKIIEIQESRPLKEILVEYPVVYPGIASKSLMHCFLATALADGMNWKSQSTKGKLTMAAIMQDICLEDDDHAQVLNLGSKIYNEFDSTDQEKIKQHPNEAAELAKLYTTFPDLDSLVIHHHELPNKNGFPNQPSSNLLTANNAVFNISMHLATKLDGNEITSKLVAMTLNEMQDYYGYGAFKEPLKLMQKVLKSS